ncbi:helix-turn-helix transcriptional regulator [Micromonospora sonneratiae]|uniref:Helix-turn-helix transcriptional regulator n=1 Tax=Micromonospora sonneratiae TaxID=1184706 RepID=A0ABW3Y8M3_9ACTN
MSRTPPNRIRELRLLAGLSQRDLAERVNELAQQRGLRTTAASADTVSRWERGAVTPQPTYRRMLAEALAVSVEDLQLDAQPARRAAADPSGEHMNVTLDPRVEHSQDEWRYTRRALNAHRYQLAQVAACLYPEAYRLGSTGLITHPDWLPDTPIDLSAIDLEHQPHAPHPASELDGQESEASHTRPMQTLTRRYARYTHAIRDLAKPRLFENRLCWRLTELSWAGDKGFMAFGDTTYFAACDMFETTAHELAYVTLGEDGTLRDRSPNLRDLPFRRLIGDPFNLGRRPLMPAISTLTIRNSPDGAEFLLHRRDPRSVVAAGGMLQVIPSGIFQPSSVLPAAQESDFDLWRNFMREFSEELFGDPEHDGAGQPLRYDQEPFTTLDQGRQDGRIRIYCLGVALDALTLVGEVLTVAVVESALFDQLSRDFVDDNDEGHVVAERVPFTADAISELLTGERLAPAGAGCVELAWRHRERLLS